MRSAWLLVALPLAAIAILAVAIVNGGPIIYPDSIAYLIDGERIVHLSAPYATRAVPYGIFAWMLQWGGWSWAMLFVQSLIVAALMWLVARVAGARLSPTGFIALTLGLVVTTPLAWHAAHLLPDIFVAAMVLAIFALGFCAGRLGRTERVGLAMLIAAAASFHITAMPLAVSLAFLIAVVRWRRGDRSARPLFIAAPVALALLGTLAFNALVWHRLTLTPNSPPFLLARLIADGPARDFLRVRCPDAGFELCRYLDQLPATEEQFMWQFMSDVPPESGRRIKSELGAVVGGTVAMFPMRVLGHFLLNGARQLVTFQSETALSDAEWAEFQGYDTPLAQAARDTLQARRWFERPNLDGINAFHAVVAAVSLVAAVVLLARSLRLGAREPAALLGTVLFALLVNAYVTGPLSGVFGRFGGRMIWLLPYSVVVTWLALRRSYRAPSLERGQQGAVV